MIVRSDPRTDESAQIAGALADAGAHNAKGRMRLDECAIREDTGGPAACPCDRSSANLIQMSSKKSKIESFGAHS